MIFGIIYPLILLNSTLKGNSDSLQFDQSTSRNGAGYVLRKNHIIVPKKFLISRNVMYNKGAPSVVKKDLNLSPLSFSLSSSSPPPPPESPLSSSLLLSSLSSSSLSGEKKINEFLYDSIDISPQTFFHDSDVKQQHFIAAEGSNLI